MPSLFSELKVIKYFYFIPWPQLLFCDIFPGWSLNKREPDYPSDEDIAEYLAMVRDGYRIPYSGPQQMEIGESQGFEAVMRSNSLILGVGKHMRCAAQTDGPGLISNKQKAI